MKIILIKFIIPAIITLVISITSGLLLDYYKNLAPKLLGKVQKGKPIEMNGKKICSYIIEVCNSSNKTIHQLTLNIQSSQTELKSTGATITKGLKFDSLIKDNVLEVYIPFLSKDDKFSVTVYVENQGAEHKKPVLVIRSPEKFNHIDSVEQKGNQSLLFNIPKNINKAIQKVKSIVHNTKDDSTTVMSKSTSAEQTTNKKDRQEHSGNKNLSNKKKAMIITVSIMLVMVAGISGKIYLSGKSTKVTPPAVKTTVPKPSTSKTESTTGNRDATKSKTETPSSSGEKTETPSSSGTKTETPDSSGTKTETPDSSGEKTETPSPTVEKTKTPSSAGEKTETPSSSGTKTETPDSSGTKTETPGSTGAASGTTVK